MKNSFLDLGLEKDVEEHLFSLGFKLPTPIQEKSLPISLQKHDLIAQAHTGSGKTLAFSLPILNNITPKKFNIQSLVLAPTRELAAQIAIQIRDVLKYHHNIKVIELCGGTPYKPQVHSLSHKAHIIVGTPGRVLKHLQENNFDTQFINTFVLDEADRMIDMGFIEDMKEIISYLPSSRQTLLFSATYPETIKEMANEFMQNPQMIQINEEVNKPQIEEKFIYSNRKYNDIINVLDTYLPQSVMIFCNMKIECDELADFLETQEIYPLVLHSDLDQHERNETLVLFSNKSYKILISSDVASRGLDIEQVDLVINYNLPRDTEFYTHRIGRTGRNNKEGVSVSLIDDMQKPYIDLYNEKAKLETLEQAKQKYNDSADYETYIIYGGKKQKIRKGDIVGSFINEFNLDSKSLGQIDLKERASFIAIQKEHIKNIKAKSQLKIKGKFFRYEKIS